MSFLPFLQSPHTSSKSSKINPPFSHRFDAQLTAVKERLEAAKVSTRGVSSASNPASSGFSFGGAGSRIAKPLRGGGGNEYVNGAQQPNIPTISNLQAQEANGNTGVGSGPKRTSWFFDRR